jgi:hypothetical protein
MLLQDILGGVYINTLYGRDANHSYLLVYSIFSEYSSQLDIAYFIIPNANYTNAHPIHIRLMIL